VKHLQKQLDDLYRENDKLKNQLRVQEEQSKQDKSPRRARPKKKDVDRIHVLETKIEELKTVSHCFLSKK